MAISNFTMPHPDFINDEIINPDEFDANSAAISSKLSEIITTLNSLGLSVVPYTGATASVDMGDYSLRAGGVGLKDGNADGIYFQFNEDTDGRLALKSRFTVDGAYRTNLMYMTTDGIFSIPNQSFVHVTNTGTQSINGTLGVNTKIVLDSEASDNQNEFASSRFTAKSAGVYDLRVYMNISTAPSGEMLLRIYKNGVSWGVFAVSRNERLTIGSCHMKLSAGDYIELYADMDNGGTAKTLGAGMCSLTIAKVS